MQTVLIFLYKKRYTAVGTRTVIYQVYCYCCCINVFMGNCVRHLTVSRPETAPSFVPQRQPRQLAPSLPDGFLRGSSCSPALRLFLGATKGRAKGGAAVAMSGFLRKYRQLPAGIGTVKASIRHACMRLVGYYIPARA